MSAHKPGKDDRATLIVLCVLVIPVLWLALILAPLLADKQGLAGLLDGLNAAMENPLNITWVERSPKFMLLFALVYVTGVGVWYTSRRKLRPDEEYGSAQWGSAHTLKRKYAARDPTENVLLTQNFRIGLDGRIHRRNLNVLCIGGSGSGKTRFYAKPNVMQANTSFVITDPKGEVLRDTGHLMKELGYDVKIVDLINMNLSYGYNPFAYIQSDNDVLKLVTNLIRNTTPKSANSADPFWEKTETALLQALILYLYHEAPEEEQNFGMVMEMLHSAEAREDDEDYVSALDDLFFQLGTVNPKHIALKQYHIYKMASGKTAKSILVSVGVRLATFNLSSVIKLTNVDEIDIPSLGERKTIVYLCIPDNDSSFNYIIGMLYTQMFQQLYYLADHTYGGRLPVHVHFVMDEFPNIALPDDFDKILATMRSRELSVSIIIQNMAQLKALFKDNWESLVGNCDLMLYLGGNESGTHEYISKMLGKSTIDTTTHGRNRGKNGSYSDNYQQTGRELLTSDEIRMLDNRRALAFIRGERAILDDKYDLMAHPNIKLTADGGMKPYNHGDLSFLTRTIDFDEAHKEDYVLLTDDELDALYWIDEEAQEKNEGVKHHEE